ncbi:MAG: response regulator [Rhodanobacteraceae bacterium]
MARVLIVEDQYMIAAEIQSVLERAGYEVVGRAPLTKFAMETAEKHRPDVVIVDIQLAMDLDGVKTAVGQAVVADIGPGPLFMDPT